MSAGDQDPRRRRTLAPGQQQAARGHLTLEELQMTGRLCPITSGGCR